MKHKIVMAVLAVLLIGAPIGVLAQDGDGEPVPTDPQAPVVIQVDDAPPVDDFFDMGIWVSSAIVLLISSGGMVSIVIIDKGIKNVVLKILDTIPGDGEWQSFVRIIVIYGAVVVACWFAVDENGLNVFVSAPQQVIDMIPGQNAQLIWTAGLLALSVFLTHNVVKWFTPQQPAQLEAEA